MGEATLVTGATGFIGSHLVRSLVADRRAGSAVRALVQPGQDATALTKLDVEVVPGDLRDAAAVKAAARGCKQVFHLAAQSRGHGARLHREVNVEGTRNVVSACLEAGVDRLVHASTAGVYGLIRDPPAHEASPTRPNSHYRATKLLAEEHLRGGHARDGLPVVIARLTDTVGAGTLSWLGLCRAVAMPGFRRIGAGRNVNQLCHVSDIVAGLKLCAERPGIEGRSYILSGERAIPVAELIAWIAEDLGVPPSRRQLPDPPFQAVTLLGDLLFRKLGVEVPVLYRYALFVTQKAYDISRAREELGFVPTASVREGVHAMLAWYREAGHL